MTKGVHRVVAGTKRARQLMAQQARIPHRIDQSDEVRRHNESVDRKRAERKAGKAADVPDATTLRAARTLLQAYRRELHDGHVNASTGQVDDADAARDIAELDQVIAGLAEPSSTTARKEHVPMSEATTLERAATAALLFSLLPPIGQPLEGGTFCGIVTAPDGTHNAVVLLADEPGERKTWKDALAWAETVKGQLPTRPVAALLYANSKASFEPDWYWTNEAEGASYAWGCYFYYGNQYDYHESFEGRARAVRLIRVSA